MFDKWIYRIIKAWSARRTGDTVIAYGQSNMSGYAEPTESFTTDG